MAHSTSNSDGPAAHRRRLLEGMAQTVAAKGYADTTIADIVREAAVSRRTFYEHFPTKADCFIALYTAASHNALDVLRNAIDPQQDWDGQAEAVMGAYFDCLSQNPVLMRTLFVEILGLGYAGLAARRRVNEKIAAFMFDFINAEQRRDPSVGPVTPELAMAIVGGINELLLQAIERGQVERLRDLIQPAVQLLRRVTRHTG